MSGRLEKLVEDCGKENDNTYTLLNGPQWDITLWTSRPRGWSSLYLSHRGGTHGNKACRGRRKTS